MRTLKTTVFLVLVLSFSVFAGENGNAVISLDFDPSTSAIDSTYTAHADSASFSIAIRLSGITSLKGYSVKFIYDTSKVSYTGYELKDAYNSNLLGTGPMSFVDEGKGSVEVVASGSQITATSGYIGTITFKSKILIGQSLQINADYAEITDKNNSLDLVSKFHGGTFSIDPPVSVGLRLNDNRAFSFQYRNSNIDIKYSGKYAFLFVKITINDLAGKLIKTCKFRGTDYTLDLHRLNKGNYVMNVESTDYKRAIVITIR